jgi:hypothetical protein
LTSVLHCCGAVIAPKLPALAAAGVELPGRPKIFWRLLLSLTEDGLGLFDTSAALLWCCDCTDSFAAGGRLVEQTDLRKMAWTSELHP